MRLEPKCFAAYAYWHLVAGFWPEPADFQETFEAYMASGRHRQPTALFTIGSPDFVFHEGPASPHRHTTLNCGIKCAAVLCNAGCRVC